MSRVLGRRGGVLLKLQVEMACERPRAAEGGRGRSRAISNSSLQIFRKAADLEQLAHGLGEFREEIRATVVMDFAAGEIDLNQITFSDSGVQLRALHNRKTGVDRVPVKRSRERTGDNRFKIGRASCRERE